ncbi:MAG: polysaccharide deacetylase family protein [Anaerolineales bacterium]|nr:polysaccharide deacetylase family protein [Anaerolineales bacterium]
MKQAYLTIDDAPSRDFTAKMEFLYGHKIPAIFFCEGRFIQQRKEAVCTAIERGFVIGNHAFSHPHFSDRSVEECKQEIQKTDELIESVYRLAGVEWSAKYFRFPYFDSGGDESGTAYESKWNRPASEWFQYSRKERRDELQQYLRELGYRQPRFEGINPKYFDTNLLADVDVRCTYDQAEYWLNEATAPWGLSEEAVILARIEEDLPYDGRSLNCKDTVDIILVHDHEKTTALFYRIIERYMEKGIQFLPIP